MSANVNTPLLKNPTPTEPSTSDPSSLARIALLTLGATRALFGTAVLIAPLRVMGVFGMRIAPAYALLPRMFAARDLILGELILASDHKVAEKCGMQGGRDAVRRALWASVAADLADAVIFWVAFGRGEVSGRVFGLGAGGAAVFALLGLDALWLLK